MRKITGLLHKQTKMYETMMIRIHPDPPKSKQGKIEEEDESIVVLEESCESALRNIHDAILFICKKQGVDTSIF